MNGARTGAWLVILLAVLLLGVMIGLTLAPRSQVVAVASEGAAPSAPEPPTPSDVDADKTDVPAPPTPAPGGGDPRFGPPTYVVRPGDTLSGIAELVYGDPTCFGPLIEANGISETNPLEVGQELLVPPAECA